MDVFLIELILWFALLFFLWALKDGLGRMESEIENLSLVEGSVHGKRLPGPVRYSQAEEVKETIGTYRDAPIYRYAVIDGKPYQFDHVCPTEAMIKLEPGERCLQPGLIYIPCT